MTVIDFALTRLRALMAQRGLEPARCLVLLPYAQLLPVWADAWACAVPDGFAPRFATTLGWARECGAPPPEDNDFRGDASLDALSARTLLAQVPSGPAGLGDLQRDALVRPLVEAASQLAPVLAAVAPAQRAAWLAHMREALAGGFAAPGLRAEAIIAQLALAWVGASRHSTDVLWTEALQRPDAPQQVLVVPGLLPDALTTALLAHWGAERAAALPHAEDAADTLPHTQADAAPDTAPNVAPDLAPGTAPKITIRVHRASDVEDEAQRTAACVLHHLQPQQSGVASGAPVALVAVDRSLTRRVRALLDAQGVSVRDETGWRLSTTRAAAHLLAALQAAAPNAGPNAVLDWLKNCPAVPTDQVTQLEQALRRTGARRWSAHGQGDLAAAVWADAQRATLQGRHRAANWLALLTSHLQHSGQWSVLQADAAGQAVLATLHLLPAQQARLAELPQGRERLSLADFSAWCQQALEAASFVPPAGAQARVVVLPLAQLAQRPFAAVVMAGCDEQQLSTQPELPGIWTPAQRELLGLPTAARTALALRLAWNDLLARAHTTPAGTPIDLLWRELGAEGAQQLASPLLQAWELAHSQRLHLQRQDLPPWLAGELRQSRRLTPQPVTPPQAVAPQRVPRALSASSYGDLRHCPYRFFALRMLRLRADEELERPTDKRDYGIWLHAVLKGFHEGCATHNWPPAEWPQRLDAQAATERAAAGLDEAEFLPFAAAWPQVRDGYLAWWDAHQRQHHTHFQAAEVACDAPCGPVQLIGTLDRIDQGPSQPGPDGQAHPVRWVLDYKTEAVGTTRQRVADALEDTQMACYAALLGDDTVRAAYVNVGEADGTQLFEQTDIVAARDALIEGVLADVAALRGGAALRALGEGSACDTCDARGLCRKDFWDASA